MGTLGEMIRFIEKSRSTVETIEKKLKELQKVFDRNFNHVREVRISELEFLQNEFFEDPEKFPKEIRELYTTGMKSEKGRFAENFKQLQERQDELLEKRKKLDGQRQDHISRLKASNTSLDRKEEKLKEEISSLEKEIDEYNRTIGELSSGFGFLINLGKMKKIDRTKKEIIAKREDLIEKIEDIRGRWVTAEENIESEDTETREEWGNIQTDYALVTEKLATLYENREALIKNAAITGALGSLKGDEPFLRSGVDVPTPLNCRKCGSENKKNLFFCHFCGEPFAENRRDIEGSLVETGELNRVYDALSAGIRQSVSLIALFKGLREGMDVFIDSVGKVKKSQDSYSQLPSLDIDVPKISRDFASSLETIESGVDPGFLTLHPSDFADEMKNKTEQVLTDKNIEAFFMEMGNELDRRTKEQWK